MINAADLTDAGEQQKQQHQPASFRIGGWGDAGIGITGVTYGSELRNGAHPGVEFR